MLPSCIQILYFGLDFDEKIEVMEQTSFRRNFMPMLVAKNSVTIAIFWSAFCILYWYLHYHCPYKKRPLRTCPILAVFTRVLITDKLTKPLTASTLVEW